MSDEALQALLELSQEQEDFEKNFDEGVYDEPSDRYNDN